ncbi:MAG: hypothetical protein ABI325_03440 [Ginsengibacter sp.]
MEDQKKFGYIYKITIIAAVGGLLLGYDTAVVAGAIRFMAYTFWLFMIGPWSRFYSYGRWCQGQKEKHLKRLNEVGIRPM